MPSCIEGGPIPHNHVYSGIDSPQSSKPTLREAIQGLSWMLDQDEDIIVAVRSRVPARYRAEEIDPLRLVGLDEPLDDPGEDGISCKQVPFWLPSPVHARLILLF